jgi:flagellin
VRDVDVATETAAMARSQVLVQAAVSVLAQANMLPQLALKLLG